MSKLDIPTIQRANPERARQISESTGRGQDWIRTPAALGTTLALALLVGILLAIGMVRP